MLTTLGFFYELIKTEFLILISTETLLCPGKENFILKKDFIFPF